MNPAYIVSNIIKSDVVGVKVPKLASKDVAGGRPDSAVKLNNARGVFNGTRVFDHNGSGDGYSH